MLMAAIHRVYCGAGDSFDIISNMSSHGTPAPGTLAGIRVLDLTRMLSGPYCTMLLGDHGAEVIKIEPFEGDTSRGHGPYRDDDPRKEFGGYFQSVNRNKKSIALDLKRPEAQEIVRRLADTSDVVVENFRPGVMDRLGLGYEALSKTNPKLVYAALRGFGDPSSGASPYADWPAYDVVAQAMGGLMGLTGPDADSPTKIGPGIGDIFPGVMTSLGITMALHHAERSGRGQFLDVSMYDAILALCERAVYQYSFAGIVPAPAGNEHPMFVPFGLFQCQDGWISIACPNDAFWRTLAAIMALPELAADPRCATKVARASNRAFVNDTVKAWVAARSKRQLAQALGGHIPFGPVNTVEDMFGDPHVSARGMLAEVEHPGSTRPSIVANTPIHFQRTPGGVRHRAPYLSEHASELLGELGYDAADIQRLREASCIL
jgi:crotonobetainyl-CoA:carnitine CoA-transferase CaiB-like acyl-CoA transferase